MNFFEQALVATKKGASGIAIVQVNSRLIFFFLDNSWKGFYCPHQNVFSVHVSVCEDVRMYVK